MAGSLARLLAPRSITVIGASAGGGIPALPLRFLRKHGFPGALYPVNPRQQEIEGLRCYPDIAALPEVPDLAMVMLGAARVGAALEACGAAGVPFAIVCGSGFAETGAEGAALQDEVAAIAARHGIGLLGPNCQGMMNVPGRVFAGFSSAFHDPGFGFGIAGMAEEAGLGLARVVTLGNAAGLQPADILDGFADDDGTETIGLFVEGAGRAPRRLLDAARRCAAAGKPVLGWIAGMTSGGARAAAAHTAALAGDARLTRALLEEAGIIPVEDIADLPDLARALAPRRRARGRRMAVVTISGGAGVAMVDEAERRGLAMAPLAAETTAALAEVVPSFGSTANPVDVTAALIAEPERLTRALDLVAADAAVDMVAVVPTVLQGAAAATVAQAIAATAARTDKPILASWCPRPGLAEAAHATLAAAGVPNFPSPVRCVRALAALATPLPAGAPARPAALHGGPATTLAEHAAMGLLEAAGIPTARAILARTAEEAAAAAARIGAACALKVQSPDIPHKSDAGAVALGVTPADAAAAFARVMANARAAVPQAHIEGVLVQRMVGGGVEVILGLRHDPAYGPAVLVGLGGVLAEALEDVAVALCPVSPARAAAMVAGLRGARLLAGFRGAPPADAAALERAICALSELGLARAAEIETLEVNPLLVLPRGEGVVAVDALAVLRAP
jgi:acyl-CoA synthetase (NDP forming)